MNETPGAGPRLQPTAPREPTEPGRRDVRNVLWVCAALVLAFYAEDVFFLRGLAWRALWARVAWAAMLGVAGWCVPRLSARRYRLTLTAVGVGSGAAYGLVTYAVGGFHTPLFAWSLALPPCMSAVVQDEPLSVTAGSLSTWFAGLLLMWDARLDVRSQVIWSALFVGSGLVALIASLNYRRLRRREAASVTALGVERHAREAAEAASRARQEVLAVVAHDLRSPLTAISTTAQLMLRSSEMAAERPRAELIWRSARQMDHLINNLLDVTRLEMGRLPVDTQLSCVAEIVGHALETMRPLADAKFQTLAADVQLTRLLRCDPLRVFQALCNLIGNAVKFTPEGGAVTLKGWEDDATLSLSVSDTGPGIPPEQLAWIFEPYWQARQGDRRGVGLGLAIVRGIAEAHGGRVAVRSVVGQGTTFELSFPRERLP